jgi:hypothetical protein
MEEAKMRITTLALILLLFIGSTQLQFIFAR